jgi:hypothetical protein
MAVVRSPSDKCLEKGKGGADVVTIADGGPTCVPVGPSKGGCEEVRCNFGGANQAGPCFLRTRQGDLLVGGPVSSPMALSSAGSPITTVDSSQAHVEGSIYVGGDQPLLIGGGRCVEVLCKVSTVADSIAPGVVKKQNNRKIFPNLPFNMLRKLLGAIHGNRRSKSRKENSKASGFRRSEEGESESDPNQNPSLETQQSVSIQNEVEGIGLEVVLPFHLEDRRDSGPVLNDGSSGLMHLVEGGGFIVEENEGDPVPLNIDVPIPPSDLAEAKKLISIGEELGINFKNGEDEDVARMMGLEQRDRSEK